MAAHHSKVIWTEGMFLRPQHFQQLERYLERHIALRTAALQGHYWGFRHLRLDTEALALGKIALRQAHGVLPDGMPFAFDSPSDGPAALEIDPKTGPVTVVLALPRLRPGAEDVVFEDGTQALARYLACDAEVEDSGALAYGPADMQIGRLRLRLMLETELSGDWVALPVARVVERRADHRVVLDDHYIPPWLAAGEHPELVRLTEALATLLDARSQALAQRLGQPGRGGAAEASDHLLLALVNRYLGAAWHHRQFPARHPEAMFRDWCMLASELATYTRPERRPQVWPRYDHDDMGPAFDMLMIELRRALSTVLEQHALPIPLVDRGHGVQTAQVADTALLRDAALVFAVRADLPADTVRLRFPTQVKIGPVERIRDLVHLQLPGVSVRALPAAPRELPYTAGFNYFELDKQGDLWPQVLRGGALALHLAGEFPDVQIALWAIRA